MYSNSPCQFGFYVVRSWLLTENKVTSKIKVQEQVSDSLDASHAIFGRFQMCRALIAWREFESRDVA